MGERELPAGFLVDRVHAAGRVQIEPPAAVEACIENATMEDETTATLVNNIRKIEKFHRPPNTNKHVRFGSKSPIEKFSDSENETSTTSNKLLVDKISQLEEQLHQLTTKQSSSTTQVSENSYQTNKYGPNSYQNR